MLVGDEDIGFAGGSYVAVQKYLHDLAGWNALPTEAQERIIGRPNYPMSSSTPRSSRASPTTR